MGSSLPADSPNPVAGDVGWGLLSLSPTAMLWPGSLLSHCGSSREGTLPFLGLSLFCNLLRKRALCTHNTRQKHLKNLCRWWACSLCLPTVPSILHEVGLTVQLPENETGSWKALFLLFFIDLAYIFSLPCQTLGVQGFE